MGIITEVKEVLTVTLKVKELMYDIRNKTFLRGEARHAAGVNAEATALTGVSGDQDNQEQVMRSIATAVNDLRTELSEFMDRSQTANADNLVPKSVAGGGEVKLEFVTPKNFDRNALPGVASNAHEYVVARAVAEWYLLRNKEDSAEYLQTAGGALVALRRALLRRVRPKRLAVMKPLPPMG